MSVAVTMQSVLVSFTAVTNYSKTQYLHLWPCLSLLNINSLIVHQVDSSVARLGCLANKCSHTLGQFRMASAIFYFSHFSHLSTIQAGYVLVTCQRGEIHERWNVQVHFGFLTILCLLLSNWPKQVSAPSISILEDSMKEYEYRQV